MKSGPVSISRLITQLNKPALTNALLQERNARDNGWPFAGAGSSSLIGYDFFGALLLVVQESLAGFRDDKNWNTTVPEN
jgi:hypothetical protein